MPVPFHLTRLPNGITMVTVQMPQMVSVSVGFWVGMGSRYEPPELNGVCHFIEHMVFKGTRRRTARQISQAVEGVGGYLNAFTSEEASCFHARASHERFETLLDVLVDMLLHSRFDPVDVEKEREVIKEEISMYLDEPQHRVQELLNETLWPTQPLGRPIAGTPKTLDAMQRPHLWNYLQRNYVTHNTVLAVAGNITHRRVLAAFAPYAAQFRTVPKPAFEPMREAQSRPALRLFTKAVEQTQLALGVRTCSRHDLRRFPLRILNAVLGENMSSRLFQLLREDLGLAYSIYTTPSLFQDTGDLVIYAGLDASNLDRALRLILKELNRLREVGPDKAELRRARDYVFGQIDLSLEGTENQMNWVGEQLLGYGKLFSPNQVKARLSKVTAGEIKACARDFFRRDRLNLALVSPLKSDAGPARLLARAL